MPIISSIQIKNFKGAANVTGLHPVWMTRS
jgi:hypothetical protein